ncbi:lyase family protein [Solicola gregarius]|uniref:argininosuccinate lyase n=1 Tax=Solicola gregarius TaxID=2908642 RepID=A0AA46TEL9_9ACTN|nr:lyase family protein [Solicola gregarius]UYM03651.1 lyase family protein [Solicola gregarius]
MTGRLTSTLLPEAQAIVQQPGVEKALAGELRTAMDVDRAHLIMLVERAIVPAPAGVAVLDAIDKLDASDLADLHERPAPRGWYLMYEGYLCEQLDLEVAGWLPTARSRNDLSATLAAMSLRRALAMLGTTLVRLQLTLLRQARAHLHTVMPGFTHGQPALPITYAHYLAAVAGELGRTLRHLLLAIDDLDECPLGAGAMGGTSIPIDAQRTAELLGFTRPSSNSLAAVASRDTALRLCADATGIADLLSRVATDLHGWISAPEPLLRLPDSLVGQSSMMPQKRNAYVLEHVQGRAAAALGAFTAMSAGTQKSPFTNSIAVHTEATRYVEEAVRVTTESVTLLRLVVSNAIPDREAMLARAESGMTEATEIANQLAFADGRGFRAAHEIVGAAARRAVQAGVSLRDVVGADSGTALDTLDVTSVAESNCYGGGPAPQTVQHDLADLTGSLLAARRNLRAASGRWESTHIRIARAVDELRQEHA